MCVTPKAMFPLWIANFSFYQILFCMNGGFAMISLINRHDQILFLICDNPFPSSNMCSLQNCTFKGPHIMFSRHYQKFNQASNASFLIV